MQQVKVCMRLAMILFFLVTGCSDLKTRLCKAERFFCISENDWPANAKQLPPLTLYKLNERYSKIVGGGNAVLEHELATRGEEAIDTILIYISTAPELDTYLVVDILDQISRTSNVNICQPAIKERVHRILRRTTIEESNGLSINDRTKIFDALCVKR